MIANYSPSLQTRRRFPAQVFPRRPARNLQKTGSPAGYARNTFAAVNQDRPLNTLMKHIGLLLSICALLVGCSHLGSERTIARGISYGMTPDQVVANLERSQKLVSRDDAKIVTEGYDSTWGMKRRNIFIFQNGKLAVHQNNPAAD